MNENIYNIQSDVNNTMDKAMIEMKDSYNSIVSRLKEICNSKGAKLNSARYEIAIALRVVNDNKLYLAGNYKSIRVFAEDVVNLGSVSVTMYLKVANTLLLRDKPVNVFGNQDYSIIQLYEMSFLDIDDLKWLIEVKRISPKMSRMKIKGEIDSFLSAKRQTEAYNRIKSDNGQLDLLYEKIRNLVGDMSNLAPESLEKWNVETELLDDISMLYAIAKTEN